VNRALLAVGLCISAAALGVSACGEESASTPAGTLSVPASGAEESTADESTTSESTTSESMAEEAMAEEAMPDEGAGVDLAFTATTLDGATFDGTTLAGKPALLWFWAPWCPTCAGQAAHMGEVADAYAGEINVVGVGGLDQADAMRTFVDQRDVGNFVHLSDEAGEVWLRFGITAQSTYVVLDASGVVVAEGNLSEDELDRALAALA